MKRRSEKHFEYRREDTIGEVKVHLRSVSTLRAMVLEMASFLAVNSKFNGFILLVDPVISEARLQEEWQKYMQTILPDITRRLSLLKYRGGKFHGRPEDFKGWPEDLGRELRFHLDEALKSISWASSERLPRPDYFSVILKVLLQHKLVKTPPERLTSKSIGQLAGCSYPTVASTLNKLDHVLLKSSSQGIELKRFPKEAWQAAILGSRKSRSTKFYQDRSGKPRTPAILMERLASLQIESVAIGGVQAAQSHFSDLDIAGNPRLDLSIHAPGKTVDLSFINSLDPALQQVNDLNAPVHLAVHFTRSAESYFSPFAPGLKRAGVVDCLLDLHEMHFHAQANEWLANLLNERSG